MFQEDYIETFEFDENVHKNFKFVRPNCAPTSTTTSITSTTSTTTEVSKFSELNV